MADITYTTTNVVGDPKYTRTAALGEAATAGMPVYLDAAGVLWKAKNDSLAHATAVGFLLAGGSAGQVVPYQYGGLIDFGAATVTKGGIYVTSANAGGIAPFADLTTAGYFNILGWGHTTSKIKIRLLSGGFAL
jgi:hypothetical protein